MGSPYILLSGRLPYAMQQQPSCSLHGEPGEVADQCIDRGHLGVDWLVARIQGVHLSASFLFNPIISKP